MGLSVQSHRFSDSIERSDPHEAAQLLPLVYDDLRRLAARRLAREAPGQTLDEPSDLVHEAYLRLLKVGVSAYWDNRAHFFGAAAKAMRRILVENARRNKCLKRGGNFMREDLDAAALPAPPPREELLALDDALWKLAATDRTAADLVELRYFGGLTIPEAARILRISSRTADRLWSYARAWLHGELEGPDQGTARNPWRDFGRNLALSCGGGQADLAKFFDTEGAMLVLTRKVGEQIVISGDICITIVAISGYCVRLGITTPRETRVDRQEIYERRTRRTNRRMHQRCRG